MANSQNENKGFTRQESSDSVQDGNTVDDDLLSIWLEDVDAVTRDWSKKQESKEHVDQFLKTISIDYSKKETQDIQEAVVELLSRYKDKINERGEFKISRIEPGGSMREKTAVWKFRGFEFDTGKVQVLPYNEFDYLGILEKSCRYVVDKNARECCAKVKDKPCSCEVPNCPRVFKPDIPWLLVRGFEEELWKSVESLCDCCCLHRDKQYKYKFRQKSTEQQQQKGCDKCIVYKQTGQLQINTMTGDTFPHLSCSLILMWTSVAMTLVAPEHDVTDEIKTTSPIKRLPIHIDFLPALDVVNTQINEGELEHECFLVPKRCRLHGRTWRLSGCVKENDQIIKMSAKHRKCYKVLKYIRDIRYFSRDKSIYDISSYHVKTAVLNHSVTCKDLSEDYTNCVTAVLGELKIAYERAVLDSFCYKFNLLEAPDLDRESD